MMDPLIIRAPLPGTELSYVASSWFQSNLRCELFRTMPKGPVFKDYSRHLNAWIHSHYRTCIRVAEMRDSPGEVVSWVAFEAGRLHFVQTKLAFRQHGIATRLLNEFAPSGEATHWSKGWERWLSTKHKFTYNPFPFLTDSCAHCPNVKGE